MSLCITIHPDANLEFFSKYDLLTPLQKKIFMTFQWWVKKFPSAFPTQEKVSKKVGCCRKHINETLSIFREWGWITLTSRGNNRSKVVGMPTHLVMMDVNKRQYFKKIEVTAEVTHSTSKVKRNTCTTSQAEKLAPLQIPDYLKDRKYSFKDKLKLSLVSEEFYRAAVDLCQKERNEKKKIILNPFTYVVGVAINMAQEAGERLRWRDYYRTLKETITQKEWNKQ